jgi:hypothetical protein
MEEIGLPYLNITHMSGAGTKLYTDCRYFRSAQAISCDRDPDAAMQEPKDLVIGSGGRAMKASRRHVSPLPLPRYPYPLPPALMSSASTLLEACASYSFSGDDHYRANSRTLKRTSMLTSCTESNEAGEVSMDVLW